MTDRAALLAAIRERPDDDTPRLVFADYLDDMGQSDRAEFIREQVEIARRFKLEKTGAGRYAYRFNEWSGVVHNDFDRGLVGAVMCSSAEWLTHGDAIFADHPVRLVRLTTSPDFRARGPSEGNPARIELVVAGRAVSIDMSDTSRGPHTNRTVLQARWPGVAFELPPAPPFPVVLAAADAIRRAIPAGTPLYVTDVGRVRTADGREGTLVGEVDAFGRATVRFD